MSDTPKLYAKRRPMELEPQYSAHMLAMTVENLRGKSEIAEELAVRDKCIVGLERENAALRAELSAKDKAISAVLEACAEVLGHDVVLGELPGELEAVRKDAERYRWLRGQCGVRDRGYIGGQWLEFPDLVYDWNWLGKKTNEQIVEAAIDSAMGGRDAA